MKPDITGVTMEKILSLSKRRGFLFQSSAIYDGLNAAWDYGPLGVELKRNVKEMWWKSMVRDRLDIVGLDSSILMNPKVWEASGHLDNFSDSLVECSSCNQRFRIDDITNLKDCPNCDQHQSLSKPREFNLMFKTFMGAATDTASEIYLRPETAQGIFINFSQVLNTSRKKLPFGIAQIGKAFRNEITPGNSIFRTREFEQMELEFFVKPGQDEEWHNYWVKQRLDWYISLGIRPENLRLREHGTKELAHYAKATVDVEYKFPWGWAELEGIANRTDFDLRKHSQYSKEDLSYFDEQTNSRFFPFVVEPSGGVDRATLAFLLDAYREEEIQSPQNNKPELRTVLRFNKHMAPAKLAVLPLSRKSDLLELSHRVHSSIRSSFSTLFDDSQSIGRRYRRQDEIGTPYCITVDFKSLEDQQVTVRERDSMSQERVSIDQLPTILRQKLTTAS